MKMKLIITLALIVNLAAKVQGESCGVPNDDQINVDPHSCQLTSPNQFPWDSIKVDLVDSVDLVALVDFFK